MCRVDPHASGVVLVRLDVVPIDSMDRAGVVSGMRDDGDFHDLSGDVQLSGGYVSSLCEFGDCGAVILYASLSSMLTYSMLIDCDCRPEYPGWCLSPGGQCYVYEPWVSGSREFAGRHCESSMSCPVLNRANEPGHPAILCPVDSGILRSSDPGPE